MRLDPAVARGLSSHWGATLDAAAAPVRCINATEEEEAPVPGMRLFAQDQHAARQTSAQQKQIQQMRQAAAKLRARGVGVDPKEWGGRQEDSLFLLADAAGTNANAASNAAASAGVLGGPVRTPASGARGFSAAAAAAAANAASTSASAAAARRSAVPAAAVMPVGAAAVVGVAAAPADEQLWLDASDWDAVQSREGRIATALTRKLRTLALRAGVRGAAEYLPDGGSVSSAAEALEWAKATSATGREAQRKIKTLERQRQAVQSKGSQSAQKFI